MRILADTSIILWALADIGRLPERALQVLTEPANKMAFSLVSIWEIAIKHMLKKPDFAADPELVLGTLRDNGWEEIGISGKHIVSLGALPDLHNDPFDRLLIAQARVQGVPLLTADSKIMQYPDVPLIAV